MLLESPTSQQIRIAGSVIDGEYPFPRTCTAALVLTVKLIGFLVEIFGSVGEAVIMVLLWFEGGILGIGSTMRHDETMRCRADVCII